MGIDEKNFIMVKFQEKTHKFKLLNVLEFNSSRKRMSVIVQNEDNQIILYCKGADSIILDRMKKNEYISYKKNYFI